MANLIREMWEDSKRHTDDATVNNSIAEVVCDGGKIEQRAWKHVKVGDILRVNKGQPLPADVVQLSSSEEQGNSYIDTCDLDGETNLKIKSSLSLTVHATTPSSVSALRGQMDYEAPNKRLYTFLGKLTIKGQTVAVDNDVVLLRGAVLRNTPWIFALVVYAGRQTKVMMNSQAAKAKRSNVDRASNVILLAVLAFMIIVCTVGCVGHVVWMSDSVNSLGIWCAQATQTLCHTMLTYTCKQPHGSLKMCTRVPRASRDACCLECVRACVRAHARNHNRCLGAAQT